MLFECPVPQSGKDENMPSVSVVQVFFELSQEGTGGVKSSHVTRAVKLR